MPILKNITGAPRTSPLADINIENVIRFLVAITTDKEDVTVSRILIVEDRFIKLSFIFKGLMHVHTQIARILLQEISLRPSELTQYFIKILTLLEIPADSSPAAKELIANAESILRKVSSL